MGNRSSAREAVIARIRKLLSLARGGGTEDEAAQAMRRAHGLLAEHNLSEAEVREAPAGDDRIVDDGSVDGWRELWPAYIWHASARLHFCRYFYQKEADGERWIGMRHHVVGRRHNVAVCKLMSSYLVTTVIRLADEGGACVHPSERGRFRRSFRLGCAERLVERLEARRAEWKHAAGAGGNLRSRGEGERASPPGARNLPRSARSGPPRARRRPRRRPPGGRSDRPGCADRRTAEAGARSPRPAPV